MKELNNDFICDNEIGIAIVNGREVYYSENRIALADIPEGFIRYEVRGKDGNGDWATIENRVVVNFVATILTDEKFYLTKHPYFNPFTGSDGVDEYCPVDSYEITDDFWDDEEDELVMWDKGYDGDDIEGYEIICWPESQDLMDEPHYRAFCFLINDEEGLERFGSSAYVVDKFWYESL